MPWIHRLACIGLVLLLPQWASAQQTASPPRYSGEGSLSFTVGVPTGAFQDNIEDPGFGGSLFAGVRFGTSPVVLGLDLNVLVYGRSRDTVPFSSTVGPRVAVDVVTTNSIVQPHLALRLQPNDGLLRPYLDGLVGFKYLFTETDVRDDDRDRRGEPIASTTNFDDFAFSGGAGAGLALRVYQGAADGDLRDLSLHLGVQYLVGQEAEYLAEGDLTDDNENGRLDASELDVRRSTTTLLQPQFGVALRF